MITSGAEGHLRGMAVRRDWHRWGVAERLLTAVEDHLHSRGCSYITLDTTEPLRRAVHFYEKRGYRSTGKVTTYFGMALFEYCKDLLHPATDEHPT
jgi:GNAT superfamily N-acetyltransferase